jgi:type IV fimbrial biogenesis protein FimT
MSYSVAPARGFTILELMITIAVAGVLAAVAIPNMRDFIRNGRLTAVANDLQRSAQIARSEAIKRQRNVVVCASDDPSSATPACSYDAFSGWIVFQDTNSNWQFDEDELVIERHDLVHESLTVINDNDAIMSYSAAGFANPADDQTPSRTIVICDSRGNRQIGNNSTARAVLIEATGRSRVSRIYDDVDDAITAVGVSCP